MEGNTFNDDLGEDIELFEQFIVLRIHIEQFLTPIAQHYNLTPIGVFVLYLISKQSNFSISRTCRKMNLNQGNASSMCKKLESGGFIKRTKNKDDERVSDIVLTDFGKQTLTAIDREIGEIVKRTEREHNTIILETKMTLKRLCDFIETMSRKTF
ncbi:MAG: MarR family winged helix-turn-helix transcriptional regulator [Acutalibacteraceae bacterium]